MAAHVIDGNALADELDCLYVSKRLPGDVEFADALATLGKLDADPRRHPPGGSGRCSPLLARPVRAGEDAGGRPGRPGSVVCPVGTIALRQDPSQEAAWRKGTLGYRRSRPS